MFAAITGVQMEVGGRSLMENIKSGDMILGAGSDLRWTAHPLDLVSISLPLHPHEMATIKFSNRTMLVAGLTTMFLQPGGTLIPARSLSAGDVLVGGDSQPVSVSSVSIGLYRNRVATILVAAGKRESNYAPHLINVDGIVAGDADLDAD